ncbi:MAG: molybdate ABC transporter substrate-binding protein [Chloroflexi bacterium]|nr:molybdate ABC transporter substrate-binding protein [Chloroflexota bacterium]
MRAWPVLVALLVTALLLGGCRSADTAPSSAVSGEVIVSAASSLTEAFADVARAFERQYPGSKVTLNFASSSALATQISEGAPADVFASADEAQMKAVRTDRLAAAPEVFARNRLVIAKPTGSVAITAYGDLAKPGLRIVLAADGVPVDNYTMQSLAAADRAGAFGVDFQARVMANVKSREANVRAALTKVQLGEADAAFVYGTDIASAREVEAVAVPDAYNVATEYLIAPLTGGENPTAGSAFVAFVRGGEGQALLTRRGFTMPPR